MSATIDFKGGKPHLVASDDETRYIITLVAIEKTGHAIATDGRSLICQEITLKGDLEGMPDRLLVSAQAIAQATTVIPNDLEDEFGEVDQIEYLPESYIAAGEVKIIDPVARITTCHAPPEFPGDGVKFPEWSQVVPDYGARTAIALNAEFLAALAKGFGCQQVVLHIAGPQDEILVTPGASSFTDRFGILMPCDARNMPKIKSNTAYSHALEQKAKPPSEPDNYSESDQAA